MEPTQTPPAADERTTGLPAIPDVEGVAEGTDYAAQIRQARRQIIDREPLYVPVPGYPEDAPVMLEFGTVDGKQVEKIAQKAQQAKDAKGTRAAIDTIAMACTGVFVKLPDHPKADAHGYVPIATLYGLPDEQPVRFGDSRLAQALEFDQGAGDAVARTAVRETFGRNEVAILAMNDTISRWFVDASKKAEGALQGE